MITGAYVRYQSSKAAEDFFEAMKLLPGRVKMDQDIHYIDNKTAEANLDLALFMANGSHLPPQ